MLLGCWFVFVFMLVVLFVCLDYFVVIFRLRFMFGCCFVMVLVLVACVCLDV